MKIDVTREHIVLGEPCDMERCPVAIALWLATGERWMVDYDCAMQNTVILSCAGRAIKAPEQVVRFMRRFDDGASVEPLSFELPD